jgi:maltose phosphorylase
MVEGFAGVRIEDETLIVNPLIPKAWKSYSFQILFKNNPIIISVSKEQVLIENRGQQVIKMLVNGNLNEIHASEKIDLHLNQTIKL